MEHSNIELVCDCKEQIPDWEGTIWTSQMGDDRLVVLLVLCDLNKKLSRPLIKVRIYISDSSPRTLVSLARH